MHIEPLFDPATFTLTYVVFDEATRDAVVIDPVLDYDPVRSKTSATSLERLEAYVTSNRLKVRYVLETHAHADHLSGGPWVARKLGAKTAIGERIREVQAAFKGILDLPESFPTDGSQFDRLLRDGEVVEAGSLVVRVLATPGHTPACVSYLIGDAVFTGDALFIEDYGVGRCDFPAGSAPDLYASVHDRLYALPPSTRVFPGHDYMPEGRELRFETTIGVSRADNVHVREATAAADFVKMRQARDATLAPPRLLWQSIQVNVAGGCLPAPHANGRRYLVLPVSSGVPET